MFFLGTSTTLQFNCMVGRKLMLLRDACWKDNLCVLPSDSGSKPFKCQKLRFGVGAKRRRPMTWSVKWFMIYLETETWNGCLGLKLWLFTLNIQKIYNTSRINCFPNLRNVSYKLRWVAGAWLGFACSMDPWMDLDNHNCQLLQLWCLQEPRKRTTDKHCSTRP